MWMTSYIKEIKKHLRDDYNFVPDGYNEDEPLFENVKIPDGEYPMTIEGKLDNVTITNGRISCCKWN